MSIPSRPPRDRRPWLTPNSQDCEITWNSEKIRSSSRL